MQVTQCRCVDCITGGGRQPFRKVESLFCGAIRNSKQGTHTQTKTSPNAENEQAEGTLLGEGAGWGAGVGQTFLRCDSQQYTGV